MILLVHIPQSQIQDLRSLKKIAEIQKVMVEAEAVPIQLQLNKCVNLDQPLLAMLQLTVSVVRALKLAILAEPDTEPLVHKPVPRAGQVQPRQIAPVFRTVMETRDVCRPAITIHPIHRVPGAVLFVLTEMERVLQDLRADAPSIAQTVIVAVAEYAQVQALLFPVLFVLGVFVSMDISVRDPWALQRANPTQILRLVAEIMTLMHLSVVPAVPVVEPKYVRVKTD